MNWNEVFVWLGSLIAIVLYYPLVSGILRDKIEQSFATWILWVVLDVIALGSILIQKGNYLLLVCYCLGGTVVVCSLIYKKQFKWTRFETFVLTLVIVCLVIWTVSGSRNATIASTLAVVISGFPQLFESYKKPDRNTGLIYFGYVFANGFSFLGGKSWTVEERFYYGMCTIFCALITVAALRKNPKQTEIT